MLNRAPAEVCVRVSPADIVPTALAVVVLALVAPSALGAQAMEIVPRFVDFTNELVVPAEGERIRCRRRAFDDELQIQRRGPGWFRPAPDWNDLLPRTYYVDLLASSRSVVLSLDRGERPTQILVRANREPTAGGGTESVTIRFGLLGEPISGIRAVQPPRRQRRNPDEILESPIRMEDAVIGLTLARELAHRCEHGIEEPLPEGLIWKRLPPH